MQRICGQLIHICGEVFSRSLGIEKLGCLKVADPPMPISFCFSAAHGGSPHSFLNAAAAGIHARFGSALSAAMNAYLPLIGLSEVHTLRITQHAGEVQELGKERIAKRIFPRVCLMPRDLGRKPFRHYREIDFYTIIRKPFGYRRSRRCKSRVETDSILFCSYKQHLKNLIHDSFADGARTLQTNTLYLTRQYTSTV